LGIAALGCGSRTELDTLLLSDAAAPLDADAELPLDSGDGASFDGESCRATEHSYLMDGEGVLYRYHPATGKHETLGVPNCGESNIAWTMTASRENAYILYTEDWQLYAVDFATLACSPTPFTPGQLGLASFFGIAVAESGGQEKLFVYGTPNNAANPILAVSDLTSFALAKVGDVLPTPPAASSFVNLTADTDGHLFAFAPEYHQLLQEIDALTGAVVLSVDTGPTEQSTWAGLIRHSDAYLFVGSRVARYDFESRTTLSVRDIGIAPIGGNTVLACSGR
jgi:hypothetical protein